jgi:NADH dehydrogenase
MRILIIGGGFGGLKLARALSNQAGIDITLIDRFNYHQFQPLFYQVATAGLDASNISFPLRKAFHRVRNVRFRLAEVQSVDTNLKKVFTDIGIFSYDMLVLATGAGTNFFGNRQLEDNAFSMKSTVEALQIRHRLIQHFEDALMVEDPDKLKQLMTIVVVGGGPTGVEVCGALAEMKKYVLPVDYPELDFSHMRIILLEGTGKTLGTMSEVASKKSAEYLLKLGVELMLNTFVKDYNGEQVRLSDGSFIPSKTVIWAAGIRGNVPPGIDHTILAKGNRIKVDRFNRVEGLEDVFALGDLAWMETPLYPNAHPQVANVAIGQAANLAKNILRKVRKGQMDEPYEYIDKGSMATVGRHLAVVDLPKPRLHFGGWLAWYIWMGLHLFLLVGVKNRLQVFVNWIYNYVTYDQNLRLIFREFSRPEKKSS